MSVCLSAWNNSARTRQIFMKFDIWFIQISLKSIKDNRYFTSPIYHDYISLISSENEKGSRQKL